MSDYPNTDPFWVERRAEFLAKKSSAADPSACGTCRSLTEAGKPVEHDECAQRATLLHAPDQPDYEILAGFSLEENEQLPARFHVPVFDDLGKPNLWHCAVCWEEGTVVQWPCNTARKYGAQVFSPLHEAETARQKRDAELAAYRALELGDPDGRVSASCDDPEHPTWLRAVDDKRGCPWCRITEVRTEALAEAKSEVVDWLVKKAHEGTEVARLADKVERGAIRIFFDAERAAAAVAPQHYGDQHRPEGGVVNQLNLEPSLATVVESVREVHAPIWQAIEDGKPVTAIECAALSGAVYALLKAIDARSPKPVQTVAALKAVAA